MAFVTVCGSARISVSPDHAQIDLGITYVGPTASQAMTEVAAKSSTLEAVLSVLDIARSDWSVQGVSVAEEYQWRQDANHLVGHRATAGITAMLTDLTKVGKLMQAAVDEASAQIRSLVWLVSADNPARHDLLAKAAIDAKRRAMAYVQALGLTLGAVDDISEIEPTAAPSPTAEPRMMMAKAGASADANLSVNGGHIELSAAVYVRFAVLA